MVIIARFVINFLVVTRFVVSEMYVCLTYGGSEKVFSIVPYDPFKCILAIALYTEICMCNESVSNIIDIAMRMSIATMNFIIIC